MAANLTTDVAFRRSRHRANKTARAFENSGCIVVVEPNQYSTRDALLLEISPAEKSQVLFVVSFDADPVFAAIRDLKEPFVIRPATSPDGYQSRVEEGSGIPQVSMAMVPLPLSVNWSTTIRPVA